MGLFSFKKKKVSKDRAILAKQEEKQAAAIKKGPISPAVQKPVEADAATSSLPISEVSAKPEEAVVKAVAPEEPIAAPKVQPEPAVVAPEVQKEEVVMEENKKEEIVEVEETKEEVIRQEVQEVEEEKNEEPVIEAVEEKPAEPKDEEVAEDDSNGVPCSFNIPALQVGNINYKAELPPSIGMMAQSYYSMLPQVSLNGFQPSRMITCPSLYANFPKAEFEGQDGEVPVSAVTASPQFPIMQSPQLLIGSGQRMNAAPSLGAFPKLTMPQLPHFGLTAPQLNQLNVNTVASAAPVAQIVEEESAEHVNEKFEEEE